MNGRGHVEAGGYILLMHRESDEAAAHSGSQSVHIHQEYWAGSCLTRVSDATVAYAASQTCDGENQCGRVESLL